MRLPAKKTVEAKASNSETAVTSTYQNYEAHNKGRIKEGITYVKELTLKYQLSSFKRRNGMIVFSTND